MKLYSIYMIICVYTISYCMYILLLLYILLFLLLLIIIISVMSFNIAIIIVLISYYILLLVLSLLILIIDYYIYIYIHIIYIYIHTQIFCATAIRSQGTSSNTPWPHKTRGQRRQSCKGQGQEAHRRTAATSRLAGWGPSYRNRVCCWCK